ncbi:oligosaccharide flippase family protein [Methyloligella sp. 2.7D]|uniref:oligosaccharide flippase family protein n=1 Tax=unclassified Methyloligella TaxID=2625955 RepID=UPI00157CF9F7|nr:oligosaccharide flippase family protein [Methyloligella sp. GL2]QKP76324.1 polysaccharide biosynthesis C-terminal domain-containing protein [Methyloligella sp. GL2]
MSAVAPEMPRRSSLTAQLARLRKLFTISSFLAMARVAGAVAGFITQLLLARTLHASSLGIFYSVVSLSAVVGLIASHGYPAIAPRFVSRYREQGRPGLILAFLHHARVESRLYVSLAGFAVLIFAALWPGLDNVTRVALFAGVAAIPAHAALRVNGSVALALRHFALAYLPDTAIRPFVLLAGVALLILIGVPFDTADVTWLLTGILAVLALSQYLLLQRNLPTAEMAPAPKRLTRQWQREAVPAIVVVLFIAFFADVDILMLTPLMSSAEIGMFGLCLKLAMLVGFAVQVAQQVVVPDLADAHARKSYAPIRDVMLKALAFPLVVTVGSLIAVAFWGSWMLSLFGPEFAGAKLTLLILLVSQLVRVLFGPNIGLITVIGAQKENSWIALTSLAVLLGGNLVLAPLYGPEGAAFAVLAAITFWMIACSVMLYRITGLRTDALYLLSKGRAAGEQG